MNWPHLKTKIRFLARRVGIDWSCLRWVRGFLDPLSVRYTLDIRRDYLKLEKQLGAFIGRGGERTDPSKRVLFVSPADDFFQFKAELMLGKALQLRGYDVTIAKYKRYRRSLKYFRLFGLNKFAFIEDHEKCGAGRPSGLQSEAMKPPYTFSGLMNLKAGPVHIGQHAISTFLAARQNGHLDLDDREGESVIEGYLGQGFRQTLAIQSLMDAVQPQVVVFNEKGYLPQAIFFDLALERDLNVIQWCTAQETDSYVLKKYTKANRKDHPFSLSEETWRRVRLMPWTARLDKELSDMMHDRYEHDNWYNRNRLRAKVSMRSPDEVRQMLGLDPAKKVATVFSHILWDATFFYGENLFSDYETWLIETMKAACANTRMNWVIKLHPDYVWKLKRSGASLHEPDVFTKMFGKLPEHVKVMWPDVDINTYSLFGTTDYCITVRGTVGIEMACRGIPVITAGTGRYSHLGFTVDSKTPEEYLKRLMTIDTVGRMTAEQIELAKKFAYALFKLRPFKFHSFVSTYARVPPHHPLFTDYDYVVNDFSDLLSKDDLRLFADWALDPRQVDFLKPLCDICVPEQNDLAQHPSRTCPKTDCAFFDVFGAGGCPGRRH